MKPANIAKYVLSVLSLAIGGTCAILLATALGNRVPVVYLSGGTMIAFWILLGVLLVTALVFAFVFPMKEVREVSINHLAYRIGAIIMSLGTLYFAGYEFANAISLLTGETPAIGAAVCLILTALFATLGSAYTLFPVLFSRRPPLSGTLTGLSLVLSMLFFGLYLYFDATHAKNGTMKLLVCLAFLFTALHLLADVRRMLNRKSNWFYRTITPIAGALSFALSFSGIIYAIRTGVFPFGGSGVYLFLLLSFLYIYISALSDNAPAPDEEIIDTDGDEQ